MPTKASPALASSKQAGNSSRRDRAGTHVSIAALSLPPGVPGDVKGELVACMDSLHWKYRSPPQQVQLRICWWGAPEGSDTVVAFHSSRGAGAAFPLTSGPRFLVRYLRDMGTLALVVEECPSGRAIGTVTLDTSRVDVSKPLQDSLQLLGAKQQVLATADVSLSIKYSALLSSFEMAEHLASADKGLPLYPLTPLTNSRRLTAAPGAAPSAAAGGGSVVTGAVTGAHLRAPGVASRQPPSKTSAQQHPGGMAAAAGSAQQGKEQQAPYALAPGTQPASTASHQSAAVAQALDTALAPVTSGVTGVTINPQLMQLLSQQQQAAAASAADPVLEVIRKAEQLKASLDQAAKAGVMLALPSLQPQQQQQQQQATQQVVHQQQQQLLQLLQPAVGSSSLLSALTGAYSSMQQRPGSPVGGSAWLSGLLGGPAPPAGLTAAAAANDSTTTQHPLLLLGPPPGAGSAAAAAAATARHADSASCLTAGELLAALSGNPAGPSAAAGLKGLAVASAVKDKQKQHGVKGQLQPNPTSRHKTHARHKHTAAAGPAKLGYSSSSDDEQSGTTTDSSSPRDSRHRRSASSKSHSSSSSSASLTLLSELDDLEELEDLLLQELLNMRQPPPAAAADKHRGHRRRSPGGHHKARADQHTQQQQQLVTHEEQQQGVHPDTADKSTVAVTGGQVSGQVSEQLEPLQLQHGAAVLLPQLHVQLLSLKDLQHPSQHPEGLFAVLKCAGQQQVLDITALLQPQHSMPQHDAQQDERSLGAQHTCSTTLAVTALLLQPPLAAQRQCLVVELWAAAAAAGDLPVTPGQQPLPAAAADTMAKGKLLGIARVPLPCPLRQQQQQPGAAAEQYCSSSHLSPGGEKLSSSSSTWAYLVAAGSYPVVDVLQGTAPAQLQLSIHLLPPDTPPAPATDQTLKQSDSDVATCGKKAGDAEANAAAATAAAAAGPEVVGLRHVIDVTLVSASGLPDATDLEAAGQQVPESRFIKYCFPGDEPLYTQECGPVSAPIIAAHARHTVLLQPGETVAECFGLDQADTHDQQQLTFEVIDKWSQQPDSLAASGALPLQQVLDLCAPTSSSSSPSPTPSSHVFLVQLTLAPGCPEAAVQPAGRPVLLQVSVAYACDTCYDMELAETVGPDDDGDGDASLESQQQQQQQQLQQQQGEQMDGQQGEVTATSNLPSSAAAGVRQVSSHSDPSVLLQSAAADQPADINTSSSSSSSSSPADSPNKPGVHDRQQAPSAALEGLTENVAAGGSRTASAAGVGGGPVGQTAELCVRVIRACGLQAGVKEAEAWLGHGSGLLGRARQLGPHPYVTLSLLPGHSSMPVVRTPFQAQTFCPQFNYQAVLPLRLDAPTLSALATAEALVEVWHHCPRSQAVAAALSRGLSSSYAMTGQQQVLLGSGHLPLQALITHPQGVQCWVVLTSQRGIAAGAVRVEVSWSHVGGEPVDATPTGLPPLIRHLEWLNLLPPAVSRRLSSFASLPPQGWRGQAVRLGLMLEELLLPGGDTQALERPRISHYCVSFRLPGSDIEVWGPSKACSSSSAGGPHLLARTWGVTWAHTHTAWGIADAALARALLAYPLTLTVHRREPGKGATGAGSQQQGLVVLGHSPQRTAAAGGGGGSGGVERASGGSGVFVPVGGVELDLSPLLATRPGTAAPSCRWVSGVYPVIHPVSKALTNTRLRLKVLLELDPAGPPPSPHWLETHPTHNWKVTGPLALTSNSIGPQQHRSLTAAAAAAEGQAGSGDIPKGPAATAAASVSVGQAAAAADSAAADTPAGAVGVGAGTQTGDAADQSLRQQQQLLLQDSSDLSGTALEPPAGSSGGGLTNEQQQQQPAGDVSAAAPRVLASTRLRASVSRVAAPPSQGVTSPAAAAAAAAGLDFKEHQGSSVTCAPPSPPEQQQQQQLALLPAATGSQLDHLCDYPYQQQLQQQQQQADGRELQLRQQQDLALAVAPAAASSGGVRVCAVRLCVESALHLDLPQLAEGWSPGLYVCCSWPFTGAVLSTPLVEAVGGPLGGGSTSASWLYATHLPMLLQQQQQQQQRDRQQQSVEEVASGFHGVDSGFAAGSGAGPVTVLFEVWCRAVPSAPAGLPPAVSYGLDADPTAAAAAGGDQLLGVACLDLSSLTLLGCVDGWYNITDAQQQTRGQIKVSLTPLRPLDGGTPALPLPTQTLIQQHPDHQMLTSGRSAAAAGQQNWQLGHMQPHNTPAAALAGFQLDSNNLGLGQAWPWLLGGGGGVDGAMGHSAPTATVAALESSLAELQQHLQHLQDSHWQQQQQAGEGDTSAVLPLPGDVSDMLLQDPQDPPLTGVFSGSSAAMLGGEVSSDIGLSNTGYSDPLGLGGYTDSAAAVDELSDAAFMALASQSTAAAEAVAEAAAASVQQQQQAVQPDRLLDTLRANLEELDKLSAALAVRIGRNRDGEPFEGGPGQASGPVSSLTPAAAEAAVPQAAQRYTGALPPTTSSAAAAAAAAEGMQQQQQRFAQIRTLSDDEEFLVAPGAALSESEPDTDELMGRVDWSLAQNSDEELDRATGPPHQQQQSVCPSALSGSSGSLPSGTALVQPLNTQDWMFDIGRSRPSAPTAAAALAAAGVGVDPSSSSSSSSKVPVHPGQLSTAAAQVQAEASAARLAHVEAAAAAEASRTAAAAERTAAAAATGDRSIPVGSRSSAVQGAAAGTAAAAQRGPDMWEQLGQVEEADEAAARHRQQRHRQQRQQQVTAVLAHSQQQQEQQHDPHDPRRLPEALECRLDALLAEFQISASGPGALVGRGAVGPLQQFGGVAQQAQAAAAFGRLDGGLGEAWASDDYEAGGGDSSEEMGGEGVPVTRVTHVSRDGLAEASGGGGGAGSGVARDDGAERLADTETEDVMPGVLFANALPPVQDDFVLSYSDGPPASWRHPASRQDTAAVIAATRPQQQQKHTVDEDSLKQSNRSAGPGAPLPRAAAMGSSSSSRHRLPGYGSSTTAPVTTPSSAEPATPQVNASTLYQPSAAAGAAAVASRPQAQPQACSTSGGGGSSGFSIRTVGRSGPPPGPVDILDEMFSFSRQPSGGARSSSSSIPGDSGSIRHPGM